MKYLLFAMLATVLVFGGCDDDSSDDLDAGTSDTDTDTDSDTDTDTDSDTDTDTDTDTDDTDTDTHNCVGGRYDPSTKMCWQHPKAPGLYVWEDAGVYCDELTVEGNSNWFLPDREDLAGLLDGCDTDVQSGGSGDCDPCAESETCNALFGSLTDDGGEPYWSSSSYYGLWVGVSLRGGSVGDGPGWNPFYVRCAYDAGVPSF